jgi:photosystem II stability/assembly factor-like uncharacterized protein
VLPSISPGGNNLFSLTEPPARLLIGTSAGVFMLEREAASGQWKVAGRSLAECHVHALLMEPRSALLFAGIQNGTIYASGDLGRSWELRDRGITQGNIYALSFVHAGGKTRLYAGTEPAHLFFSEDLGMTWKEIPSLREVPSVPTWDYPQPPHVAHVKQIAFDPQDPKNIYVCIEQGALLLSRDGGVSWEELQGFYRDVHRLAILRSDPRKMYLACGDGLYYSGDAGSHWERLTTRSARIGYPDGLVVHPDKPDIVFISGAGTIPPTWKKYGTAGSAIGRSRDGGRSWEFITKGFPANFTGNIEALTMVLWEGSYLLLAGTTEGDVLLSDDEGDSWRPIATGLPPIAKRRHHLYLKPVGAAAS